MIHVSHQRDHDDSNYANVIIDGQNFDLTIDDLRWIRDMCIEPAINMLEETQ